MTQLVEKDGEEESEDESGEPGDGFEMSKGLVEMAARTPRKARPKPKIVSAMA